MEEQKEAHNTMVQEKDTSLEEMKIREVQLKNLNKVCSPFSRPGLEGGSSEVVKEYCVQFVGQQHCDFTPISHFGFILSHVYAGIQFSKFL